LKEAEERKAADKAAEQKRQDEDLRRKLDAKGANNVCLAGNYFAMLNIFSQVTMTAHVYQKRWGEVTMTMTTVMVTISR
jgi:hypothetical protein